MEIRIGRLCAFAIISLLSLFAFAVHAGAQDPIPNRFSRSPELRTKTGKTHKVKVADASSSGYEVLYSFLDETNPMAGLIQDSAGNLYGTTEYVNALASGMVFKVDSAGNETVLYSFCSVSGCTDGMIPEAGLIQDSAGNLYGTTNEGGAHNGGTVFKLTPPAQPKGTWTETVLYSFCSFPNCTDGLNPQAGLIQDAAGNLYGTSIGGGASVINGESGGTVFKLTPPARSGRTWTETVLYSFCSAANCIDGARPMAGLIQDAAGNLYGTTAYGGTDTYVGYYGGGTVFRVDSTGKETVLYNFCSAADCTDGMIPEAGLIQDSAGSLYGTTAYGGNPENTFGCVESAGCGTLFKVDSAGEETVLHNFCSFVNCADGGSPKAGLIQDAVGNLYGTTVGTVFKADSAGNTTVLYTFCSDGYPCADGEAPNGVIQDAAGNLYGTTYSGGANDGGTVFKLTAAALTSTPNPASYNQPVTFTAKVSGKNGTPTGTVTFYNGAASLGTVALNGGIATFSTSALPVSNSNSITAVYSGDSNNAGSTLPAVTQIVVKASTAVALTCAPNPSMVGQNVACTATVTGQYGGTPTGTIAFYNYGSSLLGTVPLNGGTAILNLSSPARGDYTITGIYSGDSNFIVGNQPPQQVNLVVNGATTTTALQSSQNPSLLGASVTFTATVAATSGTPTGMVEFYDGYTPLGNVPLNNGTAIFSVSWLTAGPHSITAAYPGDSNFNGSTSNAVSQVVNATYTSLKSSKNPSLLGASITLTATLTATNGTPVGTVTFYDGTTSLGTGTLSKGKATYITSSLTNGAHSITGVYAGNSTFAGSTSPVLNQVVGVVTKTALKSSQATSLLGASVTFTATVTATGETPAGTVTFYDGTTQLGTGTLNSSGVATYSTTALTAGTHTIEAAYAGTSQLNPSSKTLTQKVEEATTTKLTYSPDPPKAGKAVTFTATVTATSGAMSGYVTFYDGTIFLGTGLLSSGVATYGTSTLTAGKHTIKATYGGTFPFKTSSGTVTLTIP